MLRILAAAALVAAFAASASQAGPKPPPPPSVWPPPKILTFASSADVTVDRGQNVTVKWTADSGPTVTLSLLSGADQDIKVRNVATPLLSLTGLGTVGTKALSVPQSFACDRPMRVYAESADHTVFAYGAVVRIKCVFNPKLYFSFGMQGTGSAFITMFEKQGSADTPPPGRTQLKFKLELANGLKIDGSDNPHYYWTIDRSPMPNYGSGTNAVSGPATLNLTYAVPANGWPFQVKYTFHVSGAATTVSCVTMDLYVDGILQVDSDPSDNKQCL